MKLRARRRVIAGAVMAVPALILLGSFVAPGSRVSLTGAAAAAPGILPTPTPTPITCLLGPTPSSLPFVPTPIPLPLCTPIPTPIPLPPPPPLPTPPPPVPTLPPLPIPSLFPGPTGNPTGNPVPPPGGPVIPGQPPAPPGFPTANGPAGGTFTGSGPTTLPNAGGAGSSTATWPQSISGHLVVADPLLAAQINYVLANPIAAQRPDLLHFSVLGSSPASFIMGGIFGSGGGGPGSPPILPATAAALLLVGLASGVFVLILRAPWRKIITGLVVVPAALAIALPATAAVLLSHPANSQATSTSARAPASASQLRTHAALTAPATITTWTKLIEIENALTAQHDQAVSDEQQIASIVATLQQPPDQIAGPHSLRPTATMMLTAEMRALIANYQVVAGAYEQSLQREYTFFVAAAQSPQQLAVLESASSRTPANVQKAIAYDVNLVQTQLAQEAAINGAIDQASPVIQQLAAIVGPVTFHAPLSGVVSQAFGPTSF